MIIKRNIIFSLESRKKNGVLITENIPIRIRVIYSGTRIDFSTGYRIDASKWDTNKQRVKNGCSNKLKQNASEINADLLMYYTYIQNIFKGFEIKNSVPSPEQIKKAFANRHNQPKEETQPIINPKILFYNVFDAFIKECGIQNNWEISTYKKFDSVKNHLTTFDKKASFAKIDDIWLTSYINYLRDVADMRNSSIEKQMNFLKWFLRWSVKKGHNNNNTFETYKPKLKNIPKKVIFLTIDELKRLKTIQIPDSKKYLERVRDVFLFCCYTGLRYSDVCNLKHSDIKENHIEVTTIKTNDSLIIDLNNHSKAILEKYNDNIFDNNRVLPVISNQNMNSYIKELCKLAKINEPVHEIYYKGNQRIDEVKPKYALMGSHTGRRTFICNALSLGIPPHIVMKWTGHSDYKAMKPYIDITDDSKANAMERFNKI